MTYQQSFEMELNNDFSSKKIMFADHCISMDRLDFDLFGKNKKLSFSFDAKEKRQNYNLSNWPKFDVPQEHVFIIDDLAARKILKESPDSGLIIRDNLNFRYIFSL